MMTSRRIDSTPRQFLRHLMLHGFEHFFQHGNGVVIPHGIVVRKVADEVFLRHHPVDLFAIGRGRIQVQSGFVNLSFSQARAR